jgi:arylsulfatase A-like enzyme
LSKRPNILWLMTDEQRADSMGYSGTPWAHTPCLDRIASSGVRFTAAYTPSPVCVPARGCLLTGRAGSSIGVLNNHHVLDLDDPRFLTWQFAAAGYQVASFGKHHYQAHRRAFDLEGRRGLGERVGYFAYQVPVDADEAGVVRYEGGKFPWLFAGRYPGTVDATPEMGNVRQALDWMGRRDPSRPYLLRLSFNAPHTPVVTPAPFDTLIDPDAIDLPIDHPDTMAFASDTQRDFLCFYAGTQRLSEAQIRRARQCYYGHVAFVDHAFGRLLESLEAMGELENTVIAYVSDHGAHLGDHGFFQKQSFWDAAARVPFFVAGPGIEVQEITTPVNIGSLLPTLLDWAGLQVPQFVHYPILAATLADGEPVAAEPVFSEIDLGLWGYRSGERRVMVRDGRWKLSLYRDPRDPGRFAGRKDAVLFDLEVDPGERHNLAPDPAYKAVVGELAAEIDDWDWSRPILAATPRASRSPTVS